MNGLMGFFVVVLTRIALVVGTAFVLSKTVPRMPNKTSRFVFLFVVCLLLWFTYGYVKDWAEGYHASAMNWPVALIFALLWASLINFLGPQSHNSKTQ